ncbi:MAG: hypothetical protein ABJA10_00030 [Aestuariivirga sp.]
MNSPSRPGTLVIHLKPSSAILSGVALLALGLFALWLALQAVGDAVHLGYASGRFGSHALHELFQSLFNLLPAPVQVVLFGLTGASFCLLGLLVLYRFITNSPVYICDEAGIHGGMLIKKHAPWGAISRIDFNHRSQNSIGDKTPPTISFYAKGQNNPRKPLLAIQRNSTDVQEAELRNVIALYRPDLTKPV